MPSPQILYENPDFLVVNKPAGLMVHGVTLSEKREMAKEDKEPTLVDWLLERYPEIKSVGDDPEQRPGIVHRLDKGTSGVMLVARNQKTFEYLKSLFQKHEVKKTYLALVAGALKDGEGVIDAPIGILTGSTRRSVHSKKMSKEAVTEYKVIRRWGVDSEPKEEKKENRHSKAQAPSAVARSFSLLEVRPRTGRTHQIRVHLASIGHPIVGDMLYGSRKSLRRNKAKPQGADPRRDSRLMLHARSIEFVASDGNRMRFEAEPPSEFETP